MPSTDQVNFSDLRKLAEQLVSQAGRYLLQQQSSTNILQYKDRQDICTTADLEAEAIIIKGIRNKFSNHNIISEEAGRQGEKSPYTWIIDPLDGTKEYIRGVPLYNSAIALEFNDKLVAAAIYRPYSNELYSASLGDGAFLNHQAIHVSVQTSLADSFVYCYLPSFQRNAALYPKAWSQLQEIGQHVYRIRSLADENTALCWLARGGHEAYLNLGNPPKWHDISPGLLIAQEAGAVIDQTVISQLKAGESTSLIIANNVTIFKELKKVILED